MNSMEAARQVMAELNALDIPYMVVGSLSSNFYAIPRSTQDADFVLKTDDQIAALKRNLDPHFRLDPQIGFETKFLTTKYVFQHRETPFKIELFLLSDDDHDQLRFQRRLRQETQGLVIYVPTAEDVIIQKLRWARPKDRQDVKDILDLQGTNLDFDYIHHWCAIHGSTDTLREIQAMPFE